MKREEFYKSIAGNLGKLSQDNLDGLEVILGEAERRETPINDLAYMLATAWWETAKTMQPVREAFFVSKDPKKAEQWRKNNLHYYPYYGRGYVQLTWKRNYEKASKEIGLDFVADPDLAMVPEHATRIMFTGMREGWFTGRTLDDYIDEIDDPDSKELQEYVKARRIINGTDKDTTIAKIALHFEQTLGASGYEHSRTPLSQPAPSPKKSRFEERVASFGLRHFKPYEFLTKGSQHTNPNSPAYGRNTDPPEELWDRMRGTAQILDELRGKLNRPIVMTSVYRSADYNRSIGGETNSLHMQFNAIDFAVLGSPVGPTEWAKPLRDMRAASAFAGGIGVYSTFVHLDTRGHNADWVG